MSKIFIFFVLMLSIPAYADEVTRFGYWLLVVKEDKFTDEINVKLKYQPPTKMRFMDDYDLSFYCDGNVILDINRLEQSRSIIEKAYKKNSKISIIYRLDKNPPVTEDWIINQNYRVYTHANVLIDRVKNGKTFIIKINENDSKISEFNLNGLQDGYKKLLLACPKI